MLIFRLKTAYDVHRVDLVSRYTPSQQGEAYNSGAKQRVIRMVEVQKDPMSPPRFKINKKIPRGPPSPPAPVMHSPTRKVTVKEQQVRIRVLTLHLENRLRKPL